MLPKKITYVCNGGIVEKDDIKGDRDIEAMDAFPVDPEREKTVQTARKWAGNKSNSDGVFIKNVEFETDNSPITDIIIHDYDYRQDRVVYKVIVRDKYAVDLRHEHLMDVITNSKIENGVIHADMVWAKMGSQMNLIMVGGETYNEIVEKDKETAKQIAEGTLTTSGGKVSLHKDTKLKVGFFENAHNRYFSLGKHSSSEFVGMEFDSIMYTELVRPFKFHKLPAFKNSLIASEGYGVSRFDPLNIIVSAKTRYNSDVLDITTQKRLEFPYFGVKKSFTASSFEGVTLTPEQFITNWINEIVQDFDGVKDNCLTDFNYVQTKTKAGYAYKASIKNIPYRYDGRHFTVLIMSINSLYNLSRLYPSTKTLMDNITKPEIKELVDMMNAVV
jgi:hypothetical protein